jgi:hypothetical protein
MHRRKPERYPGRCFTFLQILTSNMSTATYQASDIAPSNQGRIMRPGMSIMRASIAQLFSSKVLRYFPSIALSADQGRLPGGGKQWRNICYPDPVPSRSCFVTFTDSRGIRHSVEVTAESLFEGGALAVSALRQGDSLRTFPVLRHASHRSP